MKISWKILFVVLVLAFLMSFAFVSQTNASPPDCNWGALTSESILEGADQGGHASDPSGDGHGPGSADEPRAGLANVVEQGNLHATCELIEAATGGD